MTFIITLVALLMERFLHWHHLRHWNWLKNYNTWLQTRTNTWPAHFILLATILPLVLIIGFLSLMLSGWLHGILKLLFATLVLLYCLGPENLWVQAYRCIQEYSKDDGKLTATDVRAFFNLPATESSQALHQAWVSALFIAANQRIFAVIFWFALLGPMGAVLYRLFDIYSTKATPDLARLATLGVDALDWLPVRLFSFIFALAGNFNKVFTIWKNDVLKSVDANQLLLTQCGIAALDVAHTGYLPEDGTAEVETLALLDRAFLIWLVILAVIVLLV